MTWVRNFIKNGLKRRLEKWLDRSACVFCSVPGTPYGCCAACRNDMPFIEHSCLLCALPLKGGGEWLDLCPNCLHKKTPLDGAWSAFHYDFPLRKALHYFKFSHHLYYGRVLGNLWLDAAKAHHKDFLPDILIPVPSHIKRLRQRGFNPAYELAKPLARHLRLPLGDDICLRTRDTRPQLSRPPQERSLNVRDAFRINDRKTMDFHGKTVLILDDVMTTGSTVREIARVLRRAGARRIAAWSLLRS